MEEILQTIISNKIYLIGAALIISMIVYAMLKKIIKLMVIILITAAIYIAVVHHTGGKLPEKLEQIKNNELSGNGEIKKVKDNIVQIIKTTEALSGQSSSSSSE
ncbi:MAG TPA: hypothetical protein PK358_07515 [Spirochaetota bacterium]|nr:hypothetical protein [Spirochaetota bacterium]HPJ34668.1 hypothetical protein [Spirochaetota bacterium]